jgi:hypothetical protein
VRTRNKRATLTALRNRDGRHTGAQRTQIHSRTRKRQAQQAAAPPFRCVSPRILPAAALSICPPYEDKASRHRQYSAHANQAARVTEISLESDHGTGLRSCDGIRHGKKTESPQDLELLKLLRFQRFCMIKNSVVCSKAKGARGLIAPY